MSGGFACPVVSGGHPLLGDGQSSFRRTSTGLSVTQQSFTVTLQSELVGRLQNQSIPYVQRVTRWSWLCEHWCCEDYRPSFTKTLGDSDSQRHRSVLWVQIFSSLFSLQRAEWWRLPMTTHGGWEVEVLIQKAEDIQCSPQPEMSQNHILLHSGVSSNLWTGYFYGDKAFPASFLKAEW